MSAARRTILAVLLVVWMSNGFTMALYLKDYHKISSFMILEHSLSMPVGNNTNQSHPTVDASIKA